MQGKAIVIAGGKSKVGDSNGWLKELNRKASGIMLFGESKEKLYELIKASDFRGIIHCFNNLEEAAKASIQISLELEVKSILFSPACSSYDQYQDFEERGNHFKNIVKPFLSQSIEEAKST